VLPSSDKEASNLMDPLHQAILNRWALQEL